MSLMGHRSNAAALIAVAAVVALSTPSCMGRAWSQSTLPNDLATRALAASTQPAGAFPTLEPTCAPEQPQIPLTTAPAPLDALPKPIAPELSFAVLAPAEGPTYAWMWRMLRNMVTWWPCWTSGKQLSLPAGYRGVGGDVAGHPGVFGLDGGKPFMAVMSNGQHVVVALRGSYTLEEWAGDFAYNLVSNAAFGPVTLGGRSVDGFTRTAQALWPRLKQALDAEVFAADSAVTRVTFTGHSLGGTVGAILSAVTAEYIATTLPRDAAVQKRVECVTFGSSPAGDGALAQWVAARVNVRSLLFQNDLTPLLPCERMPVCTITPVPTDAGAEGILWTGFTPTHGRMTIVPENMPTDVAVWQSTGQISGPNDPLSKYAVKRLAAHNCAYTCVLAKYGGYASDECHIGAGDAEEGHTACWTGPVV